MINTKAEFRELSEAGRLGNYLRSWCGLDEMRKAGYSGYLTIRARHKAQSDWFVTECHAALPPGGLLGWNNKHVASVEFALAGLYQLGATESDLVFQEKPKQDVVRRMNLEVMRDSLGRLYLTYEVDTCEPVRGIRERGKVVRGLAAEMVLRTLSQTSQRMLKDIWIEHPTAIIEASDFYERYGVFGEHMVIWEARDF